MTRYTIVLLAALAAPVLGSPSRAWEGKQSAVADKLAAARTNLELAVVKEKKLPAVAEQRANLWTRTGWDKSMVPGLIAAAELMHAASGEETKAAGAESPVARHLNDLGAAYAAMAKALDPKAVVRADVSSADAMDAGASAEKLWAKAMRRVAAMAADAPTLKAARVQDAVLVDQSPVRKAMDAAFASVRAGHKLLAEAPGTGAAFVVRNKLIDAAASLDAAVVKGTKLPTPVQAPAPST